MGEQDRRTDALRTSAIGQALTRAWRSSRLSSVDFLRPSGTTSHRTGDRSAVVIGRLAAIRDESRAWFAGSVIGTLGVLLSRTIRSSFLYRWLTTEPDPDVIVIDLSETIVLGPFVAVIDAVVDTFRSNRDRSAVVGYNRQIAEHIEERPVHTASILVLSMLLAATGASFADGSVTTGGLIVRSGVALLAVLGLRSETSLDDIRRSRTAAVVRAVLEPPESTVQSEERDDRKSPSDRSRSPGEGNQ